jgi:DNA-binding MarR family transcriptional regulator
MRAARAKRTKAPTPSHSEREAIIRLRGFLLRSLQRAEPRFNVDVPEARVLVALVECERILSLSTLTAGRLGRILSLTPGTLSPVIDQLRKDGLVEASASDFDDKRTSPFKITDKGRSALADFEDRYLSLPEEALAKTRLQPEYDKVLETALEGMQRPLRQRLTVFASDNYHKSMKFLEDWSASNWKDMPDAVWRQARDKIFNLLAHAATDQSLEERKTLGAVKQELLAFLRGLHLSTEAGNRDRIAAR